MLHHSCSEPSAAGGVAHFNNVDEAVRELTKELKHLHSGPRGADVDLVDKVESLRRFVVERPRLRECLRRRMPAGQDTLGRQLCNALYGLLGGEQRATGASGKADQLHQRPGVRRITACLVFLGALDPAFL